MTFDMTKICKRKYLRLIHFSIRGYFFANAVNSRYELNILSFTQCSDKLIVCCSPRNGKSRLIILPLIHAACKKRDVNLIKEYTKMLLRQTKQRPRLKGVKMNSTCVTSFRSTVYY